MALTNRVTSSGTYGSSSVSHTLPSGSGNNRVLIGMAFQQRNPTNINTVTFNGVAPTGVIANPTSGTTLETLAVYWLDADLPASAGTYTLATDGAGTNLSVAGISYDGAKQALPADAQTATGTGTTSTSFTLTADAGSVGVMCMEIGDIAPVSAQTAFHAQTGASYGGFASYDETDLAVSYTHTNASKTVIAFAVEPASAGTGPKHIRPVTFLRSPSASTAGTGTVT